MWCHESGIQAFFRENPLYENVMTKEEFLSIRDDYALLIDEKRKIEQSLIDFDNKTDHGLMELLYISFHEPSARRLAKEWNMSETEIKTLLTNENTFTNSEFDFLGGELYNRNDIEKYSPYKGIKVPTDMREESAYEPDLIINE